MIATGDYLQQFCTAISNAGLTPPELVEADGELHRFASNGKPGDSAGWYVLHGDGIPAGAFGDWRTGVSETWRADIGRSLAAEEEAACRARFAVIRREREADEARRAKEASDKAVTLWQAARPAPDDHVYLLGKGVKAHGLRVHSGALVVPIYDGAELNSLQFIEGNGEKRFLTGGRVKGCYFLLGKPEGTLCVAEGYATAASICQAANMAVAVAFNAGNLLPVAQALRATFPDLRLVFCADDDASTEGNPGLTKARQAAEAVGGYLAIPAFGENRPQGASDFNDLHRHLGPKAVRACIDGAQPEIAQESVPVVYRRLSDIEVQPIRWLWPGRIARGKVSLIAGNPGLGKSQISASLAAIVTTGGSWPVDGGRCAVGNVVFLSAEDDAADTIKPRLMATGADTGHCYILDAVRDTDPDGMPRIRGFNLRLDIDRLGSLLDRIGGATLLVIDPISAYLGDTDSHKNAEVRAVLAPLADLAARCGAAVVCVSHLNKDISTEAMMRVTGSLAFVAASRAAYVVTRDKDDAQRRLFLPLKNNLGNDQVGLAFTLESRELECGIQTSCVMWEAGTVSVSADEVMRSVGREDEGGLRGEIADWLNDLLYPGRMKSQEVQAKAKQSGFAWRTVQRVAKASGVVIKREGFGRDTVTYWSFASVAPSHASRASTGTVAGAEGFGASDDIERGEL